MKVAVVLLVCFVSLSYQQKWFSSYAVPRELFYPGSGYFYGSRFYQPPANYYSYDDAEEIDDGELETQGRIPANGNKLSPFHKRFLIPNFFSINSIITTSTKTIWSTVTSTASIASVQSCISANLFASAAAGGASSTNLCSRRRREAAVELIEESGTETIIPSQVEKITGTSLAHPNVMVSDQPEITSSLSDHSNEEVARKSRAITVLASTTTTVTSYSFITTNIKKFFTPAAAGALLCLPAGYTPC